MKYIALFAIIQLVSFLLTIMGFPIIAVAAMLKWWTQAESKLYHFPRWMWIWDNEEDGVCAKWYCDPPTRWSVFKWSAWRNSVNNLRYVPGISKPGRPTWIKAYFGGYFYAGWRLNNGWPVFHIWTKTL